MPLTFLHNGPGMGKAKISMPWKSELAGDQGSPIKSNPKQSTYTRAEAGELQPSCRELLPQRKKLKGTVKIGFPRVVGEGRWSLWERVFVQEKKKALNHKTMAAMRAKGLQREREKQQSQLESQGKQQHRWKQRNVQVK